MSNPVLQGLSRLLSMVTGLAGSRDRVELHPGQEAPEFELQDQDRKIHSLADYRGKWVVLYFYPRDDTPGCTIEACRFRDGIDRLRAMNAEVLGVSLDGIESHVRFAEKHGLPFPLLADDDGRVARAYGSLRRIGPLRLARRHSFIIDPQGRIARIYHRVQPKIHSDTVIADLESLQREATEINR